MAFSIQNSSALALVLLLVVACGQESGFQSGATGGAIITDGVSVEEFCGGKATRRVQQTLVFEPDTEVCAWGVDGNIASSNGSIISAVQSYTKSIDLGAEVGSICDFSLSMDEAFTVYDDDITFTFDEFAFAGDYLHREWLVNVAGLEQVGSLLRYDRLSMIGKTHAGASNAEWLEEGITGEFNTRQNAATQREGNFNLQLTRDFLDLMPRVDLTRQVHQFGFHIFGNLNASDCQHQGFNIDVDVSFVPRG
jgi:hypothetical protein